MKLVLYSGGDFTENQELDQSLLSLTQKKNPKITFIPSCFYHSDEDFSDFVKQFKLQGVKRLIKWEIDRPYSQAMKKAVFQSDIIFLGGGNTYYFLKNLKKNNLLRDLKEWGKRGGVLSGLSAGAIILTKKIDTAGFPTFDKDENDENLKNLNAMDLVEFDFFPHYRNSKRYDDELLRYSKKKDQPLYACPDGSGVVITSNEMRLVGKVACFVNGHKFFINKPK